MEYNALEKGFAEALGPEYITKKPIGMFFDIARPDPEATERSGRPRFRIETYLRKLPINKPTSRFERKMVEADKEEFPDAWRHYLKQKEKVEKRYPPLEGIPGIDIAQIEELKALGLRDIKAVADYDGNLGEIAHLRNLARQIIDIADGKTPAPADRKYSVPPDGVKSTPLDYEWVVNF